MNEVSVILEHSKKNITVTGMAPVDYDEVQGAFYLSGQAVAELSFDESFVNEAYNIIHNIWSYDPNMPQPSKEEVDEWIHNSMPWSKWTQTEAGKKFLSLPKEKQWDIAWETSFTDL